MTAPQQATRRGGPPWARLALAVAALLGALALALALGRYPLSLADLTRVLWASLSGTPHGLPPAVETVVLEVRLPRVLTAVLVGASLSAAGATYQGVFRNPLVSPSILGVSSGAGLGAVLGIFLALPVLAVQGLAFAGGLAAVALVYAVGSAAGRGRDPMTVLVLAGVVTGALLGALISLLKVLADPYVELPAITFWLLGSLSATRLGDLAAVGPMMALGLVPLVLLRWRINLMSLGEEEARALGVDTARLRIVVVAAATLMTAAAVAVAGTVGWVGLVVPHLARMLVGPSFERLLPASVLLGGAYLLAVDTLARIVAPMELPLGVVTAVVGAPFFLWLLASSRRAWR